MQLNRLGTLIGFSLQVCAGGAALIWPDDKWIGWAIFAAGTATMAVSLLWWFWSNYRLRVPFVRRTKETSGKLPLRHVDELEIVANKTFDGVIIQLDGRRFIGCTFNGALIQWEGGEFRLEGCNVYSNCHFGTNDRQNQTLMELMRQIGMLKTDDIKRVQGVAAKAMMRAEPLPFSVTKEPDEKG